MAQTAPLSQSTLPLRGTTRLDSRSSYWVPFQSTLPLRGATWTLIGGWCKVYVFQSTLPLRGATQIYGKPHCVGIISIHAPLAGSDCCRIWQTTRCLNFNPRSPCGERPGGHGGGSGAYEISIHAPLAGSDDGKGLDGPAVEISIHAPLAGSDGKRPAYRASSRNFNPRSPCGERRPPSSPARTLSTFQSTLPLRGATGHVMIMGVICWISIHAPLAGSDEGLPRSAPGPYHFNPRSPCGERPYMMGAINQIHDFNPRSPCGERR